MEPSADHDQEKIERLRRAMYSRELSGKLKNKPRHSLEPKRPIVGEDWRRPEPELSSIIVAPRTIGFVRASLRWTLGAAAVFFIGSLVFFGYYFTFGAGASPASAANIDISISGPTQIAGGEPTQLQIIITNRNRVSLQLADLVIAYPSGTRSPVDLSTDLSSQRISLGTIEPGGRRQGTVSAVFAGGGSSTANVKVELEYRLEGSSAIFVASSEYAATFSTSALSVSIDGNVETVSGQPVEFTVTISSNAPAPVRDVLLHADFPFGFTFATATPAPDRAGIWELGDIAPGTKRQVVIRGTLTGENGDERVFRFTTGTRKTPQEGQISALLAESPFTMRIAESFLGLSIAVGGRMDSQAIAAPGENVNVSIQWRNNLPTAVNDGGIVARLSGIQIYGAITNLFG